MIQNTQGMTCLEAAEMGLPIITYNPLPGHGELNAAVMEETGFAKWCRTGEELTALLRGAADGSAPLQAPYQAHDLPSALAVIARQHRGADATPSREPLLGTGEAD
jgi:UDP-N-acetylglucosamine:LPS N-acetylglucosamine transferase